MANNTMPNDRIDKAYFVIMLSGSNMRVLKLIAELLKSDEILKSDELLPPEE
jgi:hypothetical protein